MISKKKPRALMLAVCQPAAVGGQAACARMLLHNLDAVQWKAVSFPLPGQYGSAMRFIASVGILLRCIWICLLYKIDVVHLLTACGRAALFEKLIIARVLKLTGVTVIINFQGAFDHFYSLFSAKEKRFVKKSLDKLDVILCLHEDMRNFLVENTIADPGKIRVIPNAVVIESPAEKAPNESGITRLAYLGWIVSNKGLETLVQAISILVNTNKEKNFKLTITGPEIEQGLTLKLIALAERNNILTYVQFQPPVFGDKKKTLFCSTDIFVFPTRMEGFPFVLLEAMEAGLPVVSTDISPVNLIIQHGVNGLLFRKDDPSDLASQIHMLMNNANKWQPFGGAARAHVIRNYSVDKVIGQYRELYSEITA